jgi:hypothetical protein
MINNFFYILFLISLSSQPLSNEKAVIIERNKFLTAMLSIAEKPKHYFLLDIREKNFFLMNRGIVLREWSVDHVRFTGDPLPVQPFSLVSKNIQFADLRHKVNVEDENVNNTSTNNASDSKTSDNKKEDKFELNALELDDMPANYRLFLNGEISINVSSQSRGFWSSLKDTAHSIMWYTYYPILAIKSHYKKDKFTVIDISFKDRKEAQALFWAFTDGTECILLFPESGDKEAFQF